MTNMKMIDVVIEQIKELEGRTVYVFGQPEIYTPREEMAEGEGIVNIIDLLEELKYISKDEQRSRALSEYDYIDFLKNTYKGKSDNTYNFESNITNHLQFTTYEDTHDGTYIVVKVHLYGDVRDNYSHEFILTLGKQDVTIFYETLMSATRWYEESGMHEIKFTTNALRSTWTVYCAKTDEEIGEAYELPYQDDSIEDYFEMNGFDTDYIDTVTRAKF